MTLDLVRDERLRLVDRLRGLPDDAWDTPSLCAGWSVRHVLAHLVTPFAVSVPAMAIAVLRQRSLGGAMDAAARRLAAERTPQQLLASLEQNAASPFRPPGMPLTAPLTDAVAHSADIRWALGDPVADWADPVRVTPVLDFLTGRRARTAFVPAGRLRALELVATDSGWRHGHGEVVQGPGIAVAMAVLGRRPAFEELTGGGARALAAR